MSTGRMGNQSAELLRVVVVGGGTGLSTVLRGLKQEPVHITAIVTVADNGGSSGRLREEMDMPPPGDIRNVLTALADTEPLMERLMQHRFTAGTGLAGHSVGNLLIAAMNEITGDFVTAVKMMSDVLAVRGDVLPASTESIMLKAEMDDGTIVAGESQITHAHKKIKRLMLEPADVVPLDEALAAIAQADLIVFGPGSLYTSILPNILVKGLFAEIKRAKAKKVYICNVMTQPGETDDFTAADHIEALYHHADEPFLDTVIVNNAEIPPTILEKYAEKGATPVRYDEERLQAFDLEIIAKSLVAYDGGYIRHNALNVSKAVVALLQQK